MNTPLRDDSEEIPSLNHFERWDYERLKQSEMQGIKAIQEMRKAPRMTPEAIVEFIHQLSPWNLKTTGVSVLERYAEAANPDRASATPGEPPTKARASQVKSILKGGTV